MTRCPEDGPSRATAAVVVAEARSRGMTIATAESLTAGLVASTLATVPGASRVLRGGLVVYATDTKASLAGVDPRLLDREGPVDAEVARQLAAGACQRLGADVGLGITGVAGPDPQGGHAVGEVYCCVWRRAGGQGSPAAEAFWQLRPEPQAGEPDGGVDRRNAIREAACSAALRMLVDVVLTPSR